MRPGIRSFIESVTGSSAIRSLERKHVTSENPEKGAYTLEEFKEIVKGLALGHEIAIAVENEDHQRFHLLLAGMLDPKVDVVKLITCLDAEFFRGMLVRDLAAGVIISRLYEKLPRLHGVVIFGNSTEFLKSVYPEDLDFISTRPTAVPSLDLLKEIDWMKAKYLMEDRFSVSEFLFNWEHAVSEKIRETGSEEEIRQADSIMGTLAAP